MRIAVELSQVFSLQLSDSMFGGNCAANFDSTANEYTINLPRFGGFIVILRQDVYMHVVVADVTEDRVTQIPAAERILVELQHVSECLIGHRHIRRNLFLVVLRKP